MKSLLKYESRSQHVLLLISLTCLHMKIRVVSEEEIWDKNNGAIHDTA
jgi:hypothetical protein